MKKILLSVSSLFFAMATVAGATGATYYNQNPWGSTGNTFSSGVVDLKIDNESYVTNNEGELVKSHATTWTMPVSNLVGKYFFKFWDVKPGDLGEDTISIHVKNNDAWVCMNVKLTGTPENGVEEPELPGDTTPGANEGELQDVLYFTFWADDGDNVYETNENIFKQGLVKDLFDGTWWTLADSGDNLWSSQNIPLKENTVRYVGKAWCYGTLTPSPLAQGNGGPLSRGTGFSCNGEALGNLTQSDGIVADVSFNAVQYRSNKNFLCSGQGGGNPPPPPPPQTGAIFSDTFEGFKVEHFFDDKSNDVKWDVSGYDVHTHKINGSIVANLEGGHSPATQRLITQSVSTLLYHDIVLSYDRMTDDVSGPINPQTLTVEYSVNGGSSWTVLETVSGESGWTTKQWNLSPSADNKPNIKVRFTFVGTNGTNHAYIDNVTITGIN